MNQMLLMTTSQKSYELDANATGMNMTKNRQHFSGIQKNSKDLKIDYRLNTYFGTNKRILRNTF